MENNLEIANEFANLTFIYGGKIVLTSEQLKKYQKAIRKLIERNEELEENSKLTGNDIENFKAQAYMLGRSDENEAMKGVIERHYISRDKIKKDLKTCEKVYEREMKPYKRDYGLDVSLLNRKEKAELINKRNCLITHGFLQGIKQGTKSTYY